MTREDFIKTLAERTRNDIIQTENAVNATLAEIVAGKIFGVDPQKTGFFDNHCTNNCKEPGSAIVQ